MRGRDIRNSTIGGRDVAFNTLTGSDINETRLTTVPDAAKLGGVAASAYLRADTVGFVNLTLGTGSTLPVPSDSPPAVDVDALGYVHLRGSLLTNGSPAFTLPAGAKPATPSTFLASDLSNGTAQVDIGTNGEVEVQGAGPVSFDGITFKAGG